MFNIIHPWTSATKKKNTFVDQDFILIDDAERQEPLGEGLPLPQTTDKSTSYLDGLRGLAALFVFIQHYIGLFDMNIHEHGFGENGHYHFVSLPFIRVIFAGGSAAVTVFFVLSGYVLSKAPLRLIRDRRQDAIVKRLMSAVARRPLRLYLPALGASLIWAALMHLPSGIVPESAWAHPKESIFSELANWVVESVKFFNPFQTHGSNREWYSYNLVMWTIPIELKGSMLVFGLVAADAFSRSPRSVSLSIFALAVLVLLQFAKWTMACFIAGLMLASIDVYALDTIFLAHRFTKRAQSFVWHAIFITGWYLLSQPSHDGRPEYSLETPGWHRLTLLVPKAYDKDQYYRYWHSWGAVLLVYSILRVQWLQRFLNTKPLHYLGRVSFMLYLVHLPVLDIFGDRIARMFGNVNAGSQESWWDNRLCIPDVGPVGLSSRWLVSLAIALPISLGIADVGTKLLDVPSVKAGKRLVQNLGLEQSAPAKEETKGSAQTY